MAKTYRLETLSDIFNKIPPERAEAFCAELCGMIKYHHKLLDCLSIVARSEVRIAFSFGFEWTDDGERNISLRVEPEHPKEDPEDKIVRRT